MLKNKLDNKPICELDGISWYAEGFIVGSSLQLSHDDNIRWPQNGQIMSARAEKKFSELLNAK